MDVLAIVFGLLFVAGGIWAFRSSRGSGRSNKIAGRIVGVVFVLIGVAILALDYVANHLFDGVGKFWG